MLFNSHDSENTHISEKLKLGKKIYIPIMLVLVSGLVFAGCTPTTEEKEMMKKIPDVTMSEKEKKEVTKMEKESSNYQKYTPEKMEALKGNEKFIAFFHAEWCPTCRAWEKGILEADFASNVKILKINYDTATELKKEYGVAMQSTAVFFNADGSVMKKEGDPAIDVVTQFFN